MFESHKLYFKNKYVSIQSTACEQMGFQAGVPNSLHLSFLACKVGTWHGLRRRTAHSVESVRRMVSARRVCSQRQYLWFSCLATTGCHPVVSCLGVTR